ncbi:TIR-NBS-LRR-like protein [Parasponia andersonii]|uniref:TIR-NBS-LRR-like protein n=1 Tax=Parasponia andersonii TaxID=3476 RepID=A0A2P5D2E1_PARAD|nr:TIR-NBS-LRR-like protein [Parasponia andersonii]
MTTIDDPDSSRPAAVAFRLRWDVFLSFRGEDTRHSFVKNLSDSLDKEGVRAFLDDDGLNRGDEIAPSLLEAIEDSAAAIVVFSPRYAESRWCLEELAKICECPNKLILPVFHLVDPSHVRRQVGPFEKHFRVHEKKWPEDKVMKWRRAMEKVGGIAGLPVFSISEEDQKIQYLVKTVLTKLRTTPIGMAEYTVGLDSRVEKLINLLDIKSNGIRVLGLHGPGGVGKTTLATALYNKLVSRFELRSFIPNVRETSANENEGLISLQNKLINDLSGVKDPSPITEISFGVSKLEMRVNDKRVLVVLDDADDINQIAALVPEREWFHEGSRIIITARNKGVFPLNRLPTELYEVRELESSESLRLFNFHALRKERPPEAFVKRSEKIVSLTGGLPLALEVFGSFMFGKRRMEEWDDAIQKLAQIRPGNIQNVLKISYDGLNDEQEKSIFLDIACLFVQMRMKRKEVVDILKGCGFPAETSITSLAQKSLIKILEDNTLWMHDQVRDMGRQIVMEENISYPGSRSRVWKPSDIKAVLMEEKEEKLIQGMVLDFKRKSRVKDPSGEMISLKNFLENPNFTSALTHLKQIWMEFFQKGREEEEEKENVISTKPIETMAKLRLLQINHVNLRGKFNSLPAKLKWLQWKGCPLKALPSDFHAPQLAVLDLSESKLESLWGSKNKKIAENLAILNLRECHSINFIPDLSRHQKLEKITLENCKGLTQIHESIGNLQTLIYLNLRMCSNLNKLPNDVSGLKRLEKLILSRCSKLKELPTNIGSMESLKKLLADETAISSLPDSTFRLRQLEELNLNRCRHLKGLPQCIGNLFSLKELSLDGSGLEELPNSIGSLANLEKLSVMWCASLTVLPDSIGKLKSLTDFFILNSPIKELPESVGSLPNLKKLSVGIGQFLSRLPSSIGKLDSLVLLQIEETNIIDLPDEIGRLKSLETLEIRKCTSLVSLPESIGSMTKLTTLIITEAKIKELPVSIGMLENVAKLQLNNCRELFNLPTSIGNLKSLNNLLMEDTGVTYLPKSFGRLSSLIFLKMTKKPQGEVVIVSSEEESPNDEVLPTSFSDLVKLNELYARYCNISGKISDDFEKLSSLEILDLGYNSFCSLPSSLKGLSILKKLFLPHCKELKSLPPLPSSLLEIDVANCTVLETVSDLSNLESLQQLNLTSCEKVVDIPGLECLKSLRRLYMSDCNACSSEIKKRLAKGSLRNIRNISIPGSNIPSWFSQEAVTYSERRNHAIKAVIIGIVVSLNHEIQSSLRIRTPSVVDIQAKILKLDFPIFTTTLILLGVPNTNQDQFHLCRYSVHHPLVSQLKDGYQIEVTKRNPPLDPGVELKKSGIYLVYEGDDDYEGDEQSINESQRSVSEKLAKFFRTYEV